jgi:glycerol-3-phosphate dehydrogenase (NAD(P)+)
MGEKLTVLGAGSWGIASAILLQGNGHQVILWEYNPDEADLISKHRTHPEKLPQARLPDDIMLTSVLEEAVREADYIVLALPSQTVRDVCLKLDGLDVHGSVFINLSKGIEIGSLMRVSEIIKSCVCDIPDDNIATLSGPSHAEEVSVRLPTSVVVGSINAGLAEKIQNIFSNDYFRVYRSTDIVGVELGGSLKNVIAIAAGIIDGLGLGDNTLGALLTRGQAEIARMGVKLGADPQTFAGLSGMGDLITTCISRHSRNRTVGERIGRGERLKQVMDTMVMVAEGVYTSRSVYAMSEKYGVEMPISQEVYRVLFEDKPPSEAVADLMTRTLKEEVWT